MKVKVLKLECLRCGHRWIPRKVEVRICPKCKTAYWDKPRGEVHNSGRYKSRG